MPATIASRGTRRASPTTRRPHEADPAALADGDALVALLEANCPGGAWTDAQRRTLAARARVQRLAAGATLVAQGGRSPAMFGVLAGELDLRFATEDGSGSVVERAGPGRLFGLASFVTGAPSTYEAVAVSPARLAVFGPAAYDWLMDEVPGFGKRLMRHFATRLEETMRLLARSRHERSDVRVAEALARCRAQGRAQALGDERRGPWAVAVSQSELAALAGLTRQTVNQCLARWAREGWIEPAYRRLVVHRWP